MGREAKIVHAQAMALGSGKKGEIRHASLRYPTYLPCLGQCGLNEETNAVGQSRRCRPRMAGQAHEQKQGETK